MPIVLPYVSPERAARIRLGVALTERGLEAARAAATIANERAALAQAVAATSSIEAAPTKAPSP